MAEKVLAENDSIPLWKVVKEEYESLHNGTPFPDEYLRLTFYKDHIKSPTHFAKKIYDAKGNGKNILARLRDGLPEKSQSVLKRFIEDASSDPNVANAQPPDSLQDEIVEQLDALLERPDLQQYFSDKVKKRRKPGLAREKGRVVHGIASARGQ